MFVLKRKFFESKMYDTTNLGIKKFSAYDIKRNSQTTSNTTKIFLFQNNERLQTAMGSHSTSPDLAPSDQRLFAAPGRVYAAI